MPKTNLPVLINQNALRDLVISILDDENGISSVTYDNLTAFCGAIRADCDDIWLLVDAADGRFFLPEDHGLQ